MSADIVRDFKFIIRTKPISLTLAHLVIEVIVQQCDDQSSIFVVRDPATVVAFRCQIFEGREWDFIVLV